MRRGCRSRADGQLSLQSQDIVAHRQLDGTQAFGPLLQDDEPRGDACIDLRCVDDDPLKPGVDFGRSRDERLEVGRRLGELGSDPKDFASDGARCNATALRGRRACSGTPGDVRDQTACEGEGQLLPNIDESRVHLSNLNRPPASPLPRFPPAA